MQYRKKNLFLLLTLLIVTTITAMAILRRQEQVQTSAPAYGNTDESQWPVADYTTPLPSDPQKLAKRQAKGERYNKHGLQPIKDAPSNPPRYERAWSGPREEGITAIPTAQSSVVLVGEITDAQAYMSNDKTGIYSEFAIRVEEVIKTDGYVSVSPGGVVTVERFGGAVRFPSGHLQVHRISGQGVPKIGGRYVLFLKRVEEDFSILTGYEIRNGHVFPIDGSSVDGGAKLPFDDYNGFEYTAFLAIVRNTPAQ